MKIGLKIGVVALAMVATTAMLVSTGKVEAQEPASNTSNIVQVVIGKYNSGQNTCTLGNYYYNFDASVSEETKSTGNILDCKFGKQDQQAVQLQLSGNLTSGSGNTIPGSNVKLTNGTWTDTPEIGTEVSINADALTDNLTLFNKVGNVIGAASGNVTISVTVPAGQPDGTYDGTLVLTYGG